MIILISLGMLLCLLVILFGLYLLRRRMTDEPAVLKYKDVSVEGPVGFVLVAAGLAAFVILVSLYAPSLERENSQLSDDNDRIRTERDTLKSERDQLETDLDLEKEKSGKLAIDLGKANASNELLQEQYDQAVEDLADTKSDLDEQTALAGKLTTANEDLKRSLVNETARLTQALSQARKAWQSADYIALSEADRAAFDKVKSGVNALNSELVLLAIRADHWPRIAGKDAVATFEIYRKDFVPDQIMPRGAGLFDFESEEFVIKGDYQGRISEELRTSLADTICGAATRAIVQGVPLEEAIKNMPAIDGFEVDSQLVASLVEWTYVQMRIKLLAADALVLVRGYADGERRRWQRDLDNSRAAIRLHENVDPNAKNDDFALTFRADATKHMLGVPSGGQTVYGNEDLPNLRAAEVAEILKKLVRKCSAPSPAASPGSIGIKILDGFVYPQHNEVDRKARVHLLVFLKDHD
ncbi:hypothetical protein [Hoeflea sp. TYP-13]|uniref:hypothetical protein n=1 Tax=Hoeflea sp. TYP-13 TaxID=3230023 RepID=UPI0034C658A4